jgi:uncharacterized membrane protein YqjE
MISAKPREQKGHSVGEVLSEIGVGARNLVQSEIKLARAEIKDSANRLGKHAAQAVVFGVIAALSAIPMLAFFVIGLGVLLGGNYWASSLIVALVCGSVGGIFARRAFLRMKEEDISLPLTRETLAQDQQTIAKKLDETQVAATDNVRHIKEAAKGRNS